MQNASIVAADPLLVQDTRAALRRLARAVAIITTRDDQARYAMTATAVSEVSLDPPSMLICVNRESSIYAVLEGGADFCINILRRDQDHLSARCAGGARGEDRFAGGDWRKSKLGVPRLAGAQANLVCRQVGLSHLGSHAVVLGEVYQVFMDEAVDPLIYVDGRYGALAPVPAAL